MNRGNRVAVLVLVVLLAGVLAIALQPAIAYVSGSCGLMAEASSYDGIVTNARGAVLMEASTGRVLWQQNAHTRLPMASTTKIFTALAILQQCDIYEIVDVSSQAVGVEGSSIYLTDGDRLTVYDLLCGLMMRSGNDSAVALAIHCSGSVESFADYCNDMCIGLGLKDTHLVNPHGLHSDDHYTSAYDLAVVSSIAQQNEVFAGIVSSKSETLHFINRQDDAVIYNKNKLLASYDGADGIKTGYTKVAGRCYVGSATRNDMQLVTVVLNCYDMWQDSQTMLHYGFNNYTMTNIVPQNGHFRLSKDGNSSVWCCNDGFDYPTINNGNDDMGVDIVGSYDEPCLQIVVNGDVVGTETLHKIY